MPPAGAFPRPFDFQDEADRARGAVPAVVEEYKGPAEIETYTVLYERDGSAKWGVIVARTPDGARTLAKVPGGDSRGIAFLTDGAEEPVGKAGSIMRNEAGEQIWVSA